MKNTRAVLGLSTCILVTLASLGCGSGNDSPPLTAVSQTSNPLVAQYSIRHFPAGLTAWVEFGLDTTYGRQTSVMTSSAATAVEGLNILVAGMKPQTTYHMRAHVTLLDGSPWVDEDQTFKTGALPTDHPAPKFSITAPPPGSDASLTPAPGVELLSQVAPASSQPSCKASSPICKAISFGITRGAQCR